MITAYHAKRARGTHDKVPHSLKNLQSSPKVVYLAPSMPSKLKIPQDRD
jgi:hypothetical protein